jgi:hypothetical protein
MFRSCDEKSGYPSNMIPSQGLGRVDNFFDLLKHTAYTVLSRFEFEFFGNENLNERTALKSVRIAYLGVFSQILTI